jgi:hypothetical protein
MNTCYDIYAQAKTNDGPLLVAGISSLFADRNITYSPGKGAGQALP